MTEQRRRIGVMGGTFDPIHNGHLVAASEVAYRFALDEVVFVPTGQSNFKQDRDVSAAEHRYLMTVIATASNPRFTLSRVDIARPGDTYSRSRVSRWVRSARWRSRHWPSRQRTAASGSGPENRSGTWCPTAWFSTSRSTSCTGVEKAMSEQVYGERRRRREAERAQQAAALREMQAAQGQPAVPETPPSRRRSQVAPRR